MFFQWLVALIVVAILIVTLYSDTLVGKEKSSSYFQSVQKPTGKAEREAVVPNLDQYDQFYSKLNTL